jgi:hypothetical protein
MQRYALGLTTSLKATKWSDMMASWPFADPYNTAVFTSNRILSGEEWIYYVSHDDDDGAWQFHPKSGPTSEEESAVVGLKTIIDLDPSVAILSDLPLGWCAWREQPDAAWQRMKK